MGGKWCYGRILGSLAALITPLHAILVLTPGIQRRKMNEASRKRIELVPVTASWKEDILRA